MTTIVCRPPTLTKSGLALVVLGLAILASRPTPAIGSEQDLRQDERAVIDLFEEARALELNERLSSLRRGNHRVSDLLVMATSVGYRSLGWLDGGRIRVGALADFVSVDLDSVRTAGTPPGPEIVFTASAADVTHTVVDGELIVSPGSQPKVDWASVFNKQG